MEACLEINYPTNLKSVITSNKRKYIFINNIIVTIYLDIYTKWYLVKLKHSYRNYFLSFTIKTDNRKPENNLCYIAENQMGLGRKDRYNYSIQINYYH